MVNGIVPGDIGWYLSGGATNADPVKSIGGAISAVAVAQNIANGIATNIMRNIFDRVGKESKAGYTDYRVIYIQNDHDDYEAFDLELGFKKPDPEIVVVDTVKQPNVNVPVVADYPYVDGTTVGNISIGTNGVKNVNVPELASRTTAPTGILFNQPIITGTAPNESVNGTLLGLPDLEAGDFIAVYLKRVIVSLSAAKNVATAALDLSLFGPE